MGKALVIKNVDFETNKLTTVDIEDVVPCTGIELDKSTYALTAIGDTVELNATVTPSGTTDIVEWSTSNSAVATVENGTVTQTGIGSATITATCGNQTATCSITATRVLAFNSQIGDKVVKGSGTRDYAEIDHLNDSVCALVNTETGTEYKVRKATNATISASNVYPILLGANASSVHATVPNTIRITAWFIDSNTICEYQSSGGYAKVISGDSDYYDSSVSLGDRTIAVPSGANSVVFTLQKPGTGNEVTAEDVASVTITIT